MRRFAAALGGVVGRITIHGVVPPEPDVYKLAQALVDMAMFGYVAVKEGEEQERRQFGCS
jgi:hypothetical protein